ncbi:MAG TPA: hypothetical protein VG937_39685 [Polyangiaceae bacterium]|nr:hypothetical protein [Polyangiaceae bacterium]
MPKLPLPLLLATCLIACTSQKRLEPPLPLAPCETATQSAKPRILPPTQQTGSQAVSIHEGEALCIEAKPGTRWIQLEKFAAKGDAQNLSIRMQRDDDGTALSVHNPFDQALTFDALVTLENGERYPSSTCPARPHETHTEHWEERLDQVVLSNFTVREANAPSASCN